MPLPERITLTDARAMRALAHPLRMQLVALLRVHGSLTATQAAALVGESSGSTSFHLRQLARYGLVEEIPGPGRAKPWRATAQFTSWDGDDADPDSREAARLLSTVVVDRYAAQLREWVDRRDDESAEWRDAAGAGDTMMWVTADELRGLEDGLRALFAPYVARVYEQGDRPPGSRLVTVIHAAIPRNPQERDDSVGRPTR